MITFGKKKAEWIRKGGLIEQKDYSQIEKRAHEPLAQMNELGFITTDSQCGSVKEERAYVDGFMKKDRAIKFIENFHVQTNMLAMAVHIGEYDPLYTIPVTVSKQKKALTKFPFVLEKRNIDNIMKYVKLPSNLQSDVVLVSCIDPVWGRNCKYLFVEVLKMLKNI